MYIKAILCGQVHATLTLKNGKENVTTICLIFVFAAGFLVEKMWLNLPTPMEEIHMY